MRRTEVVVIGGGPAGIAAAVTAALAGAATILVDENPPDPAYWQRNVPRWYGSRGAGRRLTPDAAYRWLAARPGLERAVDAGVEVLTRHAVWGGFGDGTVGVFDGSSTWQLQSEQVILATGTTDLHLAFPGWILSGVLGGGGALDLIATYGHLDGGRRMVILGSGNLALAVARAAQACAIEVAAVVDIADHVAGDPRAAADLRSNGVEVLTRHTIRSAEGRGEVELVRLDHIDGEAERAIEADTLCVAIGRQPAIELPYLLGCDLGFDARRGGPFPLHDSLLRTSREGVLVAGDLVGVDDDVFPRPEAAEASGTLAAQTALAALGRGAGSPVLDGQQLSAPIRAGGSYLTEWHRHADMHASDELIVCRCEEITRGQIHEAVDLVGADDPDEVKRVSRAGMGVCQGRGCRPIIAGILAAHSGKSIDKLTLASYRPPLRPVPLSALATEVDHSLPRPAAFIEAEARLAKAVASGELNPMSVVRFWRAAEEALYQLADADADAATMQRAARDIERRIREADLTV